MTDQDQLLKPGDVVAGKYQIERLLGAGGMGQVYEATHRVTGKAFAVKWLLPELSSRADIVWRFIREAQVAGRFEHPNVVEVYDVGEERGSFYMVMELLRGQSLKDWLESGARPTPAEICDILIPCMRGVSRAHEAGIVHRDLKPDNIFLCSPTPETPARPKVLDFGISKMSKLEGEVSNITKTGTVMGTPHYMSPEHVRGRELDHRSDVYAFGVILYEMLAGRLPFNGETFSELVLQIATETPPPLGSISQGTPPGLVAVVERAMQREPDARFSTLDEMIVAVAPFAGYETANTSGGRAPMLRDPTRPAQPFAATQRLETPLSTESVPDIRALRGNRPTALLVGVGVAAVAVVAMVVVAIRLMGSDPQVADGEDGVPTTDDQREVAGAAPGTAEPKDAPADTSTDGPPQPQTVRIGGDEPSQPAFGAPTAPGGAEPPRGMGGDDGSDDSPFGLPRGVSTQRVDDGPAAQPERSRPKPRKERHVRRNKEPVASRKPPEPPAPPSVPVAPVAPTAPKPAAASDTNAGGRLGIRMKRDDF